MKHNRYLQVISYLINLNNVRTTQVYNKLECKDFARIDFRVDSEGIPWFLEINPLPTFAPDGTFAILAELMGIPYVEFLADTIQKAFERIGVVTT